ncbi:heme ABC transporter ATP-binding protein [Tomitella fengzijianii]|uniref:Heme ABC transporter ATP-binding protein n=1 Tax=Tomitella fengzijianii TaxID=2597660 RepID=A0A516X2U9_9ACTN|nr:heme ABC transporter ATP-binding protein [Tomitella fengzijianii]QDQ97399.1 heme ABC transporter ATP-binding protein [Tomitella fengzijianii]
MRLADVLHPRRARRGAPAQATTAAPDGGRALLQARGLSVARGERTILADVDVDVTAGRVLALVGPNGAGKSTLLAALAGDLPLSAGGAVIDGRPVRDWSASELSRRRAVLPQQHRVGFGFTVDEIVRMGRAPWARTDRAMDDDAVVAEALDICDVAGFRDRSFVTLSGGEQARVALARVLAQECPVVMLDEPTAALDLRHQETVMRIAAERARAGSAVVVVLHDLGLAAAYADRVMVLAGGRTAADGPPEEVLTDALLSAVYRHPVDVLPHPHGGRPLIVPRRRAPLGSGTAPDGQPAVDPANWAEYSRA